MRRRNIAATGLDGLVGSRIAELLKDEFNFISLPQSEFDITNKQAVDVRLKSIDFDLLLHLAAYTNVDGAESNIDACFNVNVSGTRNVFDATRALGKQYILISTDFVFDGTTPPYFEDSIPNPQSVYAQSKYEAEKIVQNNAMIVRISYPYRASFEPKKDFVRSIVRALQNNQHIKGVVDQTLTCTFIDDIACGLSHLMKNYSPEMYHLVGADSMSAHETITTICDVFLLDKKLVSKTTYSEFYKNRAPRPQYGEIKSKKNNFYSMKTLQEGLEEMKQQEENIE